EHAPVARLALRLQESRVEPLKEERARAERREAGDRQHEDEARAPALELQAQLRRALLEFHGMLRPGVTTTVVEASGSRMPSEPEASASIRWCVAHVLCSSVSCVHSSASFFAAACSFSSSLKRLRAWCCEVMTPSAQATTRTRSTRLRRIIGSRSSPQRARSRCVH